VGWVEVFVVFGLSHLVGDYLLQTDWQARWKHRGLSGGEGLKALSSHILTYTLAYVPALIWIADECGLSGGQVALTVAAISIPHLLQDDGRVLAAYMTRVKKLDLQNTLVTGAVDQTCHLIALFALALAVGQ
jgi:hypothetical protein